MSWVEIFLVFVVSHLAGDYLLQSDWQAQHKRGGLGPDPMARRALFRHVTTYTLAFGPALIWLSEDIGLWALALIPGIYIPHLIQDDGRLLASYIRRVKGCGATVSKELFTQVDQSFHLIILFATALLAAV